MYLLPPSLFTLFSFTLVSMISIFFLIIFLKLFLWEGCDESAKPLVSYPQSQIPQNSFNDNIYLQML